MDNFNLHKYFTNSYIKEAHDHNRYDGLEKELKKELESKFDYNPSVHLGYYTEDKDKDDSKYGKGYGSISFNYKDELPKNKWDKILEWVNSKGFNIESESNYYEMEWDRDRAWYPKIKFEFEVQDLSLKENLNEGRMDQSKVFDQSEVDEIIGEIREITGILEDEFNASVGYDEYRFGDGTGGFSFKWAHSRNWGGRFGFSIRENGDHKLDAISWWGKSKYGSEDIKSGNTNVQNITTWRDLDNSMLISIWAQLQPLVKKNEAETKLALDREAKAQSDYYGAKADTGRIGYGLTQQPRSNK